jgi:hypothetical protein
MRTAANLLVAGSLLLPACAFAQAVGAFADLTLELQPVERGAAGVPGGAVVDVGALSARPGGRGRDGVVRQRVAVRLESPSGRVAHARLSAQLDAETAGCTVRVDGVVLGVLPRLLDPVHRVGASVVHVVEVTVPAEVAPGPFLSAIRWIAESD